MNRCGWIFCAAALWALLAGASLASGQTLELRWKKDFPKSVSWYVRTSPGILIVKSGNSLTALDGRDGQQLWELSDVRTSEVAFSDIPEALHRGLNLLEVPGLGVLLLNRVKLPSNSERRLVALNLMTGERLWDAAPVDELTTVIPLYGSGQIVVVSRRIQKKTRAAELAASAFALEWGMLVASAIPAPYRFELERLDFATGKVQWSVEYPRTFTAGVTSVKAFGEYLFVYIGNRVLGSVDLASGKLLWEDGAKHFGYGRLSLPLQMANGRLIYATMDVQAVDPGTKAVGWRIEKLGKVSGIFVHDGMVVAIGEKRMAAVDSATGVERWRKKTYGPTTNLIWDKGSDAILYADWRGLHSVERTSGKALLDARLRMEYQPYLLRMAAPESVLIIAYHESSCVSLKTGKRLFTEGELSGLFRGEAFLDQWPMPEDGQGLQRMVSAPSGDAEWETIRKKTLLSAEMLKNMEESLSKPEELMDVYQTESVEGAPKVKIWWVDGQTNRQMEIRPAAAQHDVSLPFGNVYAVRDKMLWAAKIKLN